MSGSVASQTIVIKNPQGLHARPAEVFARTAMKFQAHVEIVHLEQRVDAKSVLHLLTLGAAQGTELLLEAHGDDAQQAVQALAALVDAEFVDNNVTNQDQAG